MPAMSVPCKMTVKLSPLWLCCILRDVSMPVQADAGPCSTRPDLCFHDYSSVCPCDNIWCTSCCSFVLHRK
jgi:hypothetical protein